MNKGLFSFLSSLAIGVQGYALQLIPVNPSPEPESIMVEIVLPMHEDVVPSNPVFAQVRLRGYPLNLKTNLERAEVLPNSALGQSMHVFIDHMPYIPKVAQNLDYFTQLDNYYESMYKFALPDNLSVGKHLIQIFPARSYGESLKGPNCYASSVFYIKNKQDNKDLDMDGLALLYNEPSNQIVWKQSMPVLLDFYLRHCLLSEVGYRVKLTIDGQFVDNLTRWIPYYIRGLSKGSHTIRLELLDKNNILVPGNWSVAERSFTVE